ncbi:MAG: hypothetical protein WA950_01040 [Shinella sp.]|uniref:hypothetical protein n=1 Tax=Shinella sp. TaxID=1870904 RepID=UPI003C720108
MFGMTVFESVLERLKAEAREAAEEADGDAPEESGPGEIRGLTSGFAGLGTGATFVSGSHAAAAYLDLYEEPSPPQPLPSEPPPAPPPHLLRTTPEEVAEDLALTGKESVNDLLARRRDFARENHPDRTPEDLRTNANLRMKIANMLIDETIRRVNVEKSLGLSR